MIWIDLGRGCMVLVEEKNVDKIMDMVFDTKMDTTAKQVMDDSNEDSLFDLQINMASAREAPSNTSVRDRSVPFPGIYKDLHNLSKDKKKRDRKLWFPENEV